MQNRQYKWHIADSKIWITSRDLVGARTNRPTPSKWSFSWFLDFWPYFVAPWCSGYHYCTTSFKKAWSQVLRRFKSRLWSVGDWRWWRSLTIVPAENKATHLYRPNIPQKQFIIRYHQSPNTANGDLLLALVSSMQNLFLHPY